MTRKKENEKDANVKDVLVPPIELKLFKVKVGSIDGSTYISHRLPPETVENFVSREVGKVKNKKLRNFDEEYESCFYYTGDKKYGIPSRCFMAAILGAATEVEIPKTKIKRGLRLLGEIYPLKYKEVRRRIDNPRRSGQNSAPDERHRPEFHNWSCELTIQYAPETVTPAQIINLLNRAGFSSGVGDWRPSAPKSSGTHGMFKVLGDA